MTYSARLTYTGHPGAWRSALRVGRKTLADCGHNHRNRDGGRDNAATCGAKLVTAARHDEHANRFIGEAIGAATLGARITADEARATAQTTLDDWRAAIAATGFHTTPCLAQTQAGRTCGCCPAPPNPESAR